MTTIEALAAALEFHGRHGHETEQQAAARRVERNARAAAELRRLAAVEAELREANAQFTRRQVWWNDKMVDLEAERDALLAALNLMTDAFLDTEGNHGPEQQEAMSAAFAAMKGTQ